MKSKQAFIVAVEVWPEEEEEAKQTKETAKGEKKQPIVFRASAHKEELI